MKLLRLCFRITLVVCEEIIAAIDGKPDRFDGYRLGGEEEEITYDA